jgi:hypothetical protein
MPNWCDNSLIIKASKEKIDAIVSVIENQNGDNGLLSYLRPEPNYDDPSFKVDPTYASEVNPDFRMPSWWDWRVQNWGTKWEVEVRDWYRLDDNTISVYFDSAWSPPTGVYDHISNEYDIEALYHEGGMGFCGKFTSEVGDECYQYDISSRESVMKVPDDVREFCGLLEEHESYLEMEAE